jgi:hypothetical protein
MRIEINKFGNILVSRPDGREAFLAMSAYLTKDVPADEIIELDFDGVKVLTPSWADEVLTKLTQAGRKIKLLNTDNASVQATLKTLREFSDFKE